MTGALMVEGIVPLKDVLYTIANAGRHGFCDVEIFSGDYGRPITEKFCGVPRPQFNDV